jgi:hypothetical protein
LFISQKLHKHYVTKKNQRKRPREENLKKEDDKSSEKRLKTTDDTRTESTPNNVNAVKNDEIIKDDVKNMIVDQIPAAPAEPETEEKMEDEDLDYEEDPEEVEVHEDDADMDGATADQQVHIYFTHFYTLSMCQFFYLAFLLESTFSLTIEMFVIGLDDNRIYIFFLIDY